jgi:hypothetical protein
MKQVRKPRTYIVRVTTDALVYQDVEITCEGGIGEAKYRAVSLAHDDKWKLIARSNTQVAAIKCLGRPGQKRAEAWRI